LTSVTDGSRIQVCSASAELFLCPLCSESLVPNLKSSKKNMRKSASAAVRNRAQRSALRTALKKGATTEATPEQRKQAVQLLDRAARKGLIHANKAARHKSSIAKLANAAS
jgi:small subunit ribosomal protein S20